MSEQLRTVDDYLDAAKARLKITSDRVLSKHLEFKNNNVSQWRTRRSWPSDELMVRLADLAGIPVEQALLDLNSWRTDGAAADVYRSIAARLAKVAATVLVGTFAVSLYGANQAHATPQNPQDSAPAPLPAKNGLFIMRQWRAHLLRLMAVVRRTIDGFHRLPASVTLAACRTCGASS